jgi:hypothetical protein
LQGILFSLLLFSCKEDTSRVLFTERRKIKNLQLIRFVRSTNSFYFLRAGARPLIAAGLAAGFLAGAGLAAAAFLAGAGFLAAGLAARAGTTDSVTGAGSGATVGRFGLSS